MDLVKRSWITESCRASKAVIVIPRHDSDDGGIPHRRLADDAPGIEGHRNSSREWSAAAMVVVPNSSVNAPSWVEVNGATRPGGPRAAPGLCHATCGLRSNGLVVEQGENGEVSQTVSIPLPTKST